MNSDESCKDKYLLEGYPDLESSTVVLIKEAIKHGIKFEVIDENHSFIKLYKENHEEYIAQATKTSKDSYIFPSMVTDKEFSKRMLRANDITVPDGIVLTSKMTQEEKISLVSQFINKNVVIKPRTTDCGVGITVFDQPATEKEILDATNYAFQFDSQVLVENYAKGREYRFVVVNGKCISVVYRRSASVVGDGKKTIRELMADKDREPWHYILKNPMVIDEPLKIFLNNQNLTLDSIPNSGERIFLRRNSNCSTGGESVDMTDIMPDSFKLIAEKASEIFGAKICGVDILIDDLNNPEYSIVEINDNPGICINEWPYEGHGEKVGLEILKVLGFIE